MLEPLIKTELAGLSGDARIYCQPTCFVERPHGLDGRVARIGDGMLWFAAWQIIVRDVDNAKRETMVPVEAMAEWIAAMPEPLAIKAAAQVAAVALPRPALAMGARTVRLNEPQIMGILNLTPDSFSDGGKLAGNPEAAAAAGVDMAAAGAAIIDIGGESTRPGAPLVWEGDEIERVVPVIERLARAGVAMSIDTRKAAVMEAALAAGAAMINDVAALAYDDRATEVAAKADCPVVLMHAPSQKSDPHDKSKMAGGGYTDAALDVFDWLEARVEAVCAKGIARSRILIDPGLGFGKGVEDNLRIINALPLLHSLGVPVLFGASRKRLIGAVDGEAAVGARLGGSIALAMQAVQAGAHIVRVHDVPETRQALRLWRAGRDSALTRR
jgi:dihydropteroate synthase